MRRIDIIKALIKMYTDSYYGILFIERVLNRSDQLTTDQLQKAYDCAVVQYKQWCEINHVAPKPH